MPVKRLFLEVVARLYQLQLPIVKDLSGPAALVLQSLPQAERARELWAVPVDRFALQCPP